MSINQPERILSRRMTRVIVFITALTMPGIADAWLYTVEGNTPQPAANYKQWSGLADAVNLPSRQKLLWCNGFESLSYAGDTDALNAMLKQYAKVECSPTRSSSDRDRCRKSTTGNFISHRESRNS